MKLKKEEITERQSQSESWAFVPRSVGVGPWTNPPTGLPGRRNISKLVELEVLLEKEIAAERTRMCAKHGLKKSVRPLRCDTVEIDGGEEGKK